MKTILAYSFDMDSCVLVDRTKSPVDVIQMHPVLFKMVKDQNGSKYVFCGSARQSSYHDLSLTARYGGPLASAMMVEIAKHLDAIHNTFLVSDIVTEINAPNTQEGPFFHHHRPGTNFKNRDNPESYQYALQDEHKIVMIYSQISNLCIHEPDAEEIISNFFDDRKDILDSLALFLRTHSEIFPKKVKLMLYHYSRPDRVLTPTLLHEVSGKADEPHSNYYSVIKKFICDEILSSIPDAFGKFNHHKITREYIQEICLLGTNGQRSHSKGDGLVHPDNKVDSMLTFSYQPSTRESTQFIEHNEEQNGFSHKQVEYSKNK